MELLGDIKEECIDNYTEKFIDIFPEVGKAQLEAQSATSATSAIAEVALRFNFLF